MTRIKLAAAVLLACSFSAAGGFWFGFREAIEVGFMVDSLPRGVMATQHLDAVRSGKTQNLIATLEFNVDDGLVGGHDLFMHPLRPLLGPLWEIEVSPVYERYATRLANYRTGHPSPYSVTFLQHLPKTTAEDKEALDEAAERARQRQFKLQAMVERYASKSR